MAAPKKKAVIITPALEAKWYEVLNDGILGATEHTDEAKPHQFRILKGQVTSADLIAAGCDVEWLINSGQIAEVRLGN